MPDTQLFMTESDETELAAHILSLGCQLVPDLKYQGSAYQKIMSTDKFTEARLSTRLFFIMKEELLESPLELRPVSNLAEVFYYVSPRSGGPTIQLLASGVFTEDEKRYLRPGFLSCFPNYWSTTTGKEVRPDQVFRGLYKAVQKYVRSTFVQVKLNKASLWLGKGAAEEVAEGAWLVGYETVYVAGLMARTG
jgi:hypothetical protein